MSENVNFVFDTRQLRQQNGLDESSKFSEVGVELNWMYRCWVAIAISALQIAPSHPAPQPRLAASTIMMQYQSKLKRATGRALMPDRGGEYREAFLHGGWHSSSRIACHSSQRDSSILTC